MELLLTSDAKTVILDPSRPNFIQAQVHLVIPHHSRPPTNRLERLTVTLSARQSLSFPGGHFEMNEWRPSVTVPEITRTLLQPGGTYTWEVRLRIPDDMPSYERSQSGSCFQTLRAEAVFGGVRLFRKRLEAQKASNHGPLTSFRSHTVFLVPQPPSDRCFVYDHAQNGIGESIGPVAIHTHAQHLTVGGILHVAAQVPCPTPDCHWDAMELTLVQSTELGSRRRVGRVVECAKRRVRLLRVDGADCDAMQWTIRLPGNTEIRPSTSRKANSIQITHQMEVRFFCHTDGSGSGESEDTPNDTGLSSANGSTESDANEGASITSSRRPSVASSKDRLSQRRHTHVLSWSIHLPSCAFRSASIHLPAYSPLDASPVPRTNRDVWTGKNEHLSQDNCVCGQAVDEVLGVEREMALVHRALAAGVLDLDKTPVYELVVGRASCAEGPGAGRCSEPLLGLGVVKVGRSLKS
ncbi:hypothetical protein V8E36_009827 [Tilletia maclaganii]